MKQEPMTERAGFKLGTAAWMPVAWESALVSFARSNLSSLFFLTLSRSGPDLWTKSHGLYPHFEKFTVGFRGFWIISIDQSHWAITAYPPLPWADRHGLGIVT